MKCDFSYVLFTDECRATLDGSDGWVEGWILQDQTALHRLRRQQGGGGVNVLGRDGWRYPFGSV